MPAVLIRLRPRGPWRFGTAEGGRETLDTLFRSDRLFAALTSAARNLGWEQDWLDEVLRAASPAVRVSSLFPFQGNMLFACPPRTLWPPATAAIASASPVSLAKLRWQHARFVPLSAIETLMAGRPLQAEQWLLDAETGCLLRRDRPSPSPFRRSLRYRAAVDRVTHLSAEADSFACFDFEPGAGLWTVLTYSGEEAKNRWNNRLKGAFRFLCDSGLGGNRRIGWGHAQEPEWLEGSWPDILLPKTRSQADRPDMTTASPSLYWLLSLYSPTESDDVQWGAGNYRLIVRGNHAGGLQARFVEEGSVVSAAAEPVGRVVNLGESPAGTTTERSGLAVALRLPPIHLSAASASEPESTVQTDTNVETEGATPADEL